jgi:hypothetical protein
MKKLTTEEFITKANLVHNNRYTYDKVIYTDRRSLVVLTCPIHGDFKQRPANHLQGQGCAACAGVKQSTTKEFIAKATVIHRDKYNYNRVQYINDRTKIVIICPEHGEFQQTPNDHLQGKGCSECGLISRSRARSSNTEKFVARASAIHGAKYSYAKVSYIDTDTKVIITCQEHGEFRQLPHNHLRGAGCPGCAARGFDQNKPAYLYYLKITIDDNKVLYKIGITNRTVDERFSLTDLTKIEVVKQKLYEVGQDAYNWEQKLLKQFKDYEYKGPDILRSGNTELFTVDVIALYEKYQQ